MEEIPELVTRLVIGPYPAAGRMDSVIISLIQERHATIKEKGTYIQPFGRTK